MAGVFELIRSILRSLFFGLGSVKLVLELSVLSPKLVDLFLQFFVLLLRLGEHALPLAGLLSQLTHFTPQLPNLFEELIDESRQICFAPGGGICFKGKFDQRGIHYRHAIPKIRDPTQINSRPSTPLKTGWANVYTRHNRGRFRA